MLDAAAPCPADHVTYLSRALADNAVILHGLTTAGCDTIEPFPHGDHFHIGHPSKEAGKECRGRVAFLSHSGAYHADPERQRASA